MSGKKVIFISKSRLTQNLMELIINAVPRRLGFESFDDLAAFKKAALLKTVHLIILDQNCLPEATAVAELDLLFSRKQFKAAKKIFIFSHGTKIDYDTFKNCGIQQFYTKPFLPEEFIEIISHHLGIKA